MIDPTTLAQALPPLDLGSAAAPAAALRPAEPDAAARFAERMAEANPLPGVAAPAPVTAPNTVPMASPITAPTLGEQVLQGLQQVQGDFQSHLQAVGRMLAPGAPTPDVADLLRLQLAMAQLSVQVEVVGKAIGRSTQNLDQLVRMQ